VAEWQTRWTQNPVPSKGVGVQVPPPAPRRRDWIEFHTLARYLSSRKEATAMNNFCRAIALWSACLMAASGASYNIDPAHSSVGFSVRHLGLAEVRGIFKEFEGQVEYDPAAPQSFSLKGRIKTASVDTAVEARDQHLRGPDFFDVEKYPEITFSSESVTVEDDRLLVTGSFTLRGVTKTITLPIVVVGPLKDPWGKTRIGLSARTSINRRDYGISWSKVLDTGELVIGNEVAIAIEAEAILNEP
jgi:polyisoprenoid-binding protein YceI